MLQGWSTSTGAGLGTWTYMAPEQITGSGDEATSACDLYAAGIVLAELVTSVTPEPEPFSKQGSTLAAWKKRVGLPKDIEPVILKASEVLPGKRFKDASSFLEALHSLKE